jgi:hypothetical protein
LPSLVGPDDDVATAAAAATTITQIATPIRRRRGALDGTTAGRKRRRRRRRKLRTPSGEALLLLVVLRGEAASVELGMQVICLGELAELRWLRERSISFAGSNFIIITSKVDDSELYTSIRRPDDSVSRPISKYLPPSTWYAPAKPSPCCLRHSVSLSLSEKVIRTTEPVRTDETERGYRKIVGTATCILYNETNWTD